MTLKSILATEDGLRTGRYDLDGDYAYEQVVSVATRDHERDARTYQPSWGVCVIEAMDRIHLMDLNDPTAAY